MAKGRKTGGRKKGTPNKITGAVKQAILHAFDKVGGEDYLVKVAEDDPRTFCALLAKIIPAEITASVEHKGEIGLAERIMEARQRVQRARDTDDGAKD